MKTSYHKRDYTCGDALLQLRTAIGLTQKRLGSLLGISGRAVGEWENGGSYPKTKHLKQLIALAVQHQAFAPGNEAEEIRVLWKVAHQKMLIDECWLSGLLSERPQPHMASVGVEETKNLVPVMARPASEPEGHAGNETETHAQILAADQETPVIHNLPFLQKSFEATMLARNKWKPISKAILGLVIAALLVFALYAQIIVPRLQGNNIKSVIVSGKVLCVNNEPVVGIWANVVNGGKVAKDISEFAIFRTTNSNGSEVTFSFELKGDGYDLHVGCGGSEEVWKDRDNTEYGTGTVHDSKYHFFTCHEIPRAVGYGSCDLKY